MMRNGGQLSGYHGTVTGGINTDNVVDNTIYGVEILGIFASEIMQRLSTNLNWYCNVLLMVVLINGVRCDIPGRLQL